MEYQSSNSASTASNGAASIAATTRRNRLATENSERPQQQPQTAKEVIAANVQSLIEQLEAGHSDSGPPLLGQSTATLPRPPSTRKTWATVKADSSEAK